MFGQVVVGPPGSGKTTYCNGMQQFLQSIGRPTAIINLDPANDSLPYECAININELITLDDVMNELELGPNGGLIYCMEYLEKNLDWLKERLDSIKGKYLLFDCPGQAELFTHHKSTQNIVQQLQNWNYRITAVHLVDAHQCADASKYISVLLLSLSTMLHLELPHVNVLSKIDMVEKYGSLAFGLEFYTEVGDLDYVVDLLDQDPLASRHRELNQALCNLIQDFSLVSFTTLNIMDKASVANVLKLVDKSNGFVFGGDNSQLFAAFDTQEDQSHKRLMADQDAYVQDDDEEYDLAEYGDGDVHVDESMDGENESIN